MNQSLRCALTLLACLALASCEETKPEPADVKLLTKDIYISVAQNDLTLPFTAMENHAYRGISFPLNRKRDREQAKSALETLLQKSSDPSQPLAMETISVTVRSYNYAACPLFTREWARSVCRNPWSAIQQALPANRFKLVDLRNWTTNTPGGPRCARQDRYPQVAPEQISENAVLLCEAEVAGGDEDEFHIAAIRIHENLGAVWTVWRFGANRETAESMAEREGIAIASFVQHALGPAENYLALLHDHCRLRRPGSIDGPKGADCSSLSNRTIPSSQ
ncbi:hypothetical protein M0G74_16815 [Microbulbifer sp. CAU 1566]|uniref:hypothetical protein n=1 Tax=Microbulbifer sp. CAU 1566 TaxID=2933269 RepID=UPI0020056007|nr:hypothetical protein [Microbulbifer sp. CAU 1566]MCK7598938.1 hypothetical protein [Microbulbifer sp. CAU 1566]